MDDRTRRRLEGLARKHTPRYLFRGFNRQSGGGIAGCLNSTGEVVPHAFVGLTKSPPFHTRDPARLAELAGQHLRGERREGTEFSSWAASIAIALHFGTREGIRPVFLAVLDTENLDESVHIWHVPRLVEGLFNAESIGDYPHEYLAHGIIRGEGYIVRRVPEGFPFPPRHDNLDDWPSLGVLHWTNGNHRMLILKWAAQYEYLDGVVAVALMAAADKDFSRRLWNDFGTIKYLSDPSENMLEAATLQKLENLEASLTDFQIPRTILREEKWRDDDIDAEEWYEIGGWIAMLWLFAKMRSQRRRH